MWRRLACTWRTPFGAPVEPEEYSQNATSSGEAAAVGVSGIAGGEEVGEPDAARIRRSLAGGASPSGWATMMRRSAGRLCSTGSSGASKGAEITTASARLSARM